MSSAGRPDPADVASSDLAFQHLAIVVDDMRWLIATCFHSSAGDRSRKTARNACPKTSGGVEAFKFRDPKATPWSFWPFPRERRRIAARRGATPFLGIDRSAISVADTAASIAFYESLGLRVAARSLNHWAGASPARWLGRQSSKSPRSRRLERRRISNCCATCERGPPAGRSRRRRHRGDAPRFRFLVPTAEVRGADPDGHRYEIVAPR